MRISIIFLIALVSSCSLLPKQWPAPALPMLANKYLSKPLPSQIKIEVIDKQNYQLLCLMEQQKDRFTVVGLSGFGQRLFSAVYRDKLTIKNNRKIAGVLTVQQLMLDLQLIYWPAQSIKRMLDEVNQAFVFKSTSQQRIITQNNQEYIHIRYQNGTIQLQNFKLNYHLQITL